MGEISPRGGGGGTFQRTRNERTRLGLARLTSFFNSATCFSLGFCPHIRKAFIYSVGVMKPGRKREIAYSRLVIS